MGGVGIRVYYYYQVPTPIRYKSKYKEEKKWKFGCSMIAIATEEVYSSATLLPLTDFYG